MLLVSRPSLSLASDFTNVQSWLISCVLFAKRAIRYYLNTMQYKGRANKWLFHFILQFVCVAQCPPFQLVARECAQVALSNGPQTMSASSPLHSLAQETLIHSLAHRKHCRPNNNNNNALCRHFRRASGLCFMKRTEREREREERALSRN